MTNKMKQFAYCFDCIEARTDEKLSNVDKIKYFFECYEAEFLCPWAFREYPKECDRVAAYLRGLPFGFDYMNDDILRVGESWGFDLSDEKKQAKFINAWFERLAMLLLHLRDHNRAGYNRIK